MKHFLNSKQQRIKYQKRLIRRYWKTHCEKHAKKTKQERDKNKWNIVKLTKLYQEVWKAKVERKNPLFWNRLLLHNIKTEYTAETAENKLGIVL